MKMIHKVFVLAMMSAFILTAGCGDDDNNNNDPAEVPQIYKDLPGTLITSDTTWDGNATKSGKFYVMPGVTLTIAKGSTISFTFHNGNSDDVGAIITLRADATNFSTPRSSGRLVCEGTAAEPIVLTSANATKAPGDWGGVILVGDAPNNIPGGEGDVEGLPEVVKYGGSNATDNSGILQYVRIEYCGFGIAAGSEINGLSLYSVGSSTVLDHIQVYKCTDDGYEWFGGTVDATYLISVFNDDDSFDMDEGWNGDGQFWLAVQAPGADNGFESDGRKELGSGSPTDPTLSNVTLVGAGAGADAGDKAYGMRLREDFEGTLLNFVITNFAGVNFKLESGAPDMTLANFGTSLTIENVLLFGNKLDASDPAEFGGFSSASDSALFLDAAYTMTIGDPQFNNAAAYDFTPAAGSAALSNGATPPSGLDQTATYRGAFGVGNNWAGASWVRWTD